MALYAGIDLHSTNHVLVVIDEHDRVHYEKRLPNELGATLDALAPFRDDLFGIALESTYNWYWLVDGLMDAGLDVHLANTARMGEYGGLKYTDDKHDARWLAHMLRLGILPEGYILEKRQQALRDLLRRHQRLVQGRSTQIRTVQQEKRPGSIDAIDSGNSPCRASTADASSPRLRGLLRWRSSRRWPVMASIYG